MISPLAVWNDVLPSGTAVFGPFDINEDAAAPEITFPSFRFSESGREFVVYSEHCLSEADQEAIRVKAARRLAADKQRALAMAWLATKQRRQNL